MKAPEQQFNSQVVHLKGREKALEPFGWPGRWSEWIALACLHGGIFTRAQWTSFLGCHHEKFRRSVRALVAQDVAAWRLTWTRSRNIRTNKRTPLAGFSGHKPLRADFPAPVDL